MYIQFCLVIRKMLCTDCFRTDQPKTDASFVDWRFEKTSHLGASTGHNPICTITCRNSYVNFIWGMRLNTLRVSAILAAFCSCFSHSRLKILVKDFLATGSLLLILPNSTKLRGCASFVGGTLSRVDISTAVSCPINDIQTRMSTVKG